MQKRTICVSLQASQTAPDALVGHFGQQTMLTAKTMALKYLNEDSDRPKPVTAQAFRMRRPLRGLRHGRLRNAACRLKPPVSACRSSTSPAKYSPLNQL